MTMVYITIHTARSKCGWANVIWCVMWIKVKWWNCGGLSYVRIPELDNKTLGGERQKDKSSLSMQPSRNNHACRGHADYMNRHADKSSFPWQPSLDSQRIDNIIVGQTSLPLATLSRYVTRQTTRRTDKSSSGNPFEIYNQRTDYKDRLVFLWQPSWDKYKRQGRGGGLIRG